MILSSGFYRTAAILAIYLTATAVCAAQGNRREFTASAGGTIEVINLSGRVEVQARTAEGDEGAVSDSATLSAVSSGRVDDSEIKIETVSGRTRVEVTPASPSKRIDLSILVPERVRLKVQTGDGEVRIAGNIEDAHVSTVTGTIAADVPTEDVKYQLLWTMSRPRYLSDFEVEKVKEKSGGKFELKGKFRAPVDETAASNDIDVSGSETAVGGVGKESKKKSREKESKIDKSVSLNFTTERGIVLLNVPPNEVSSDLRERPLTEAAKAIVRSGDSVLMEAIRRASPKHFGDYARTLPPMRREPVLQSSIESAGPAATIKRATVRVTDQFNRAIPGLNASDFLILENGVEREIVKVDSTSSPFNLVLLLDVSGSVDNYVDFIRKAARNFVNTVDRNDRVSIILFNDDVNVLSAFTADKGKLSKSLDSFDAGGATAYYDALAYTLAETLRPLKGERTAVVILTDGDDNRSFIPFDGLLGAIQESGALIYPLYVPSALIAASTTDGSEVDPLRSRYMTLTSKSDGEGAKLAATSGGIYYPITQLDQIQKAYDDIVVQLRTAYAITYRSDTKDAGGRANPRTRVRVKRENLFASIGRVSRVQ